MLRSRRIRLLVLFIAIGLALIGYALTRPVEEPKMTPMDVEWADGFAYASVGEGHILRLTVGGDSVQSEVLATGLQFPRGLAVSGSTLYVAELGDLPCENPVPRCKGEHVGPTVSDGERQLLANNSGRILAYPISDNGLGDPTVLVDGLHYTNTDHGLNDLELGPDGMLYLAVGNLDQLAWDDNGSPPSGPETELLGTILRVDPGSGDVEVFATGLRNVFGITFDGEGRLWGVDNDGPGRGNWRFEELLHLQGGLDYGFPDDGTVGPYTRRTGFATWIMPTGAGSSGIHVRNDVVISGACGRVTRVRLTEGGAMRPSSRSGGRDVRPPSRSFQMGGFCWVRCSAASPSWSQPSQTCSAADRRDDARRPGLTSRRPFDATAPAGGSDPCPRRLASGGARLR